MAQVAERSARERLLELPERLREQRGFAEVVQSLLDGHGATLDGVWGSSCALVAASLAEAAPQALVVVCPHQADLDIFADDLALFSPQKPAIFPAWEASSGEKLLIDELFGDRLRVLKGMRSAECGVRSEGGSQNTPHSALRTPHSPLIIASIQSLLQPVPSQELLARQHAAAAARRRARPGGTAALAGRERFSGHDRGRAARRVLAPRRHPRYLRPRLVRSGADRVVRRRDRIDPPLRGRQPAQPGHASMRSKSPCWARKWRLAGHFADYLPPRSWFLLVEPAELEEEGRRYLNRVERPQDYFSTSATLKQIYRFPSVTAEAVASGLAGDDLPPEDRIGRAVQRRHRQGEQELDAAGAGQDVFIVCQTEAEIERLEEVFAQTQLAAEDAAALPAGTSASGFRLVPERIVLVSGGELFHRADLARPTRRRLGRVIDSFLELREGDFVVHLAHGIGRYRGLRLLEKEGQAEEHLELEFHGGTKIYVPASKIDLVQKYVGGTQGPADAGQDRRQDVGPAEGGGRSRPSLDLAVEMLELQAARGGAARASPSRRHRVAAGVRRRVPLQRNARPAHGHRRDQGRHAASRGRWTA